MTARRLTLIMALPLVLASGCGSGPASSEVAKEIEGRLSTLRESRSEVAGERLLERKAVVAFYESRRSRPVWERRHADQIVAAIRGVAADGLSPEHYHLAAIEKLLEDQPESRTAAAQAELDLLLTDAVAAVADHVRYGKVRPSALNPTWNVDPRDDAPPLERRLAEIAAAAPSVGRAIEGQRPDHFVYQGLVEALERTRKIDADGGWPTVPAGRAIKPRSRDPRIPRIRARLAVTGELEGSARDSTVYDENLRRAVVLFKARHRLDSTATIDAATVAAMNVSAAARVGQIRANLERARWVLHGLADDFMLVNLPAFKAYRIRGGRNVWESRTQIGDEAMQTPTFRATLRTVVLNPDWTVPRSIIVEEIAPDMSSGKDAVAAQGLVITDPEGNPISPASIDWGSVTGESFPYDLKQPPGPRNALGRVKFLFPNRYSIYLHDTPSQQLFNSTRRTFSHGCIRLQNALDLAELLLRDQGWDKKRIDEVLASGETRNIALEPPVPILIVYWTVSVGASGEIRHGEDIYRLDPRLLAALDSAPRGS
jgi:murein L,D-transpeptidase YcbB/YkuD